MTNTIEQSAAGHGGPEHTTVRVKVKYAASGKPYENPAVAKEQTIGALKLLVLAHFGLVEGANAGGATYVLLHARQELSLDQTVGAVAGAAEALELTLSQILVQG
jgi:hypothetical protein